MLDALVSGTTDPEVLADLALGKLRKKLPALREALEGRFEAHHALVIGAILAHLDFLDEQIDRLSDAITEHLDPQTAAGVQLAASITGIAQRTAEVLVAEIGTDMAVFPSARHLASWAGQCPGNDQSAGKRRSGRTRKGPKWLGIAVEAAALPPAAPAKAPSGSPSRPRRPPSPRRAPKAATCTRSTDGCGHASVTAVRSAR